MKKVLMFVAVLIWVGASLSFADSIAPAPSERVVFYQDDTCSTGVKIALKRGAYADLRQWNTAELGSPTWDDQISCMVIGEGISKVTLYEHTNFKGKGRSFTRTHDNPLGTWSLDGEGWNNRASSIKIE